MLFFILLKISSSVVFFSKNGCFALISLYIIIPTLQISNEGVYWELFNSGAVYSAIPYWSSINDKPVPIILIWSIYLRFGMRMLEGLIFLWTIPYLWR